MEGGTEETSAGSGGSDVCSPPIWAATGAREEEEESMGVDEDSEEGKEAGEEEDSLSFDNDESGRGEDAPLGASGTGRKD